MDDKLRGKILARIKKTPNQIEGYNDLFDYCRGIEGEDFKGAHETNNDLRVMVGDAIKHKRGDIEAFFGLYRRSLLFDAPHNFDAYMRYLEIERKPKDRFYQPRRKKLKIVVDAFQDLTDGFLDELFISCPPRIGKTLILMFYVTWLIGRDSEKANLYCAYSDVITKAFYNGVLEIINDPTTYLWKDVFPEAKVVQTNAQDETINIDRRKRFPSLTARSLYGTLNGACDCDGVLISDDLIGSIEEALNKDRLVATWSKVDNNLLTRAKETAKILWVGTRWSMIDPAGIRMELLVNDPQFRDRRYKIINIPALDENDESNFDYDYNVGFTTQYYRERRASFERSGDMASWNAQYMGQPIERDGALFSPEEMRYYNGVLPDRAPDRIFMAVDPAFGGGDYVASPVCFMYDGDIYVHDVVYDNSPKNVTQPLLANAAVKYNVAAMQIEATKATEAYKEGVREEMKKRGISINLTSRAAPTQKAKDQRIFDKAPDIRERMIFREPGTRSKAYELFMQNVYSFKAFAKNKHDDAPDSLSMAIDMTRNSMNYVEVFKRIF